MTRIYAFDLLKSWSIFLVVVGHVFLYGFRETDNIIWQFIDVVNMPMFMFISGFFSGKASVDGLIKRLRTLLLPTMFVGLLYSQIKGLGLELFLTSSMHNGYWFCFTLFCLYTFYFISLQISNCLSKYWKNNYSELLLLTIATILVVVSYRLFFNESIVSNALSIPQFSRYLPYFVYGIIVRQVSNLREFIEQNNLFFTLSLIGVFVGMYIGGGYTVCRWIIAFSYIHIMIYASTNWFANRTYKWVDYIAVRTIDIYLFHYFFLPSYLVIIPVSFISNNNIIITLSVVCLLSFLVVICTLILTKFIESSKILSYLMLGKTKNI